MDKPCVFCDPKSIRGLIAEDDHFYVVATPGQITDGCYVILIPKRHSRCIGEMSAPEASALLVLADHTAKAIKEATGKDVTMFEHGIVAQSIPHTHLHLIPADLDIGRRVHNDYPMAETDVMSEEKMMSLRDLPRLFKLSPEKAYLYWKRPEGSHTVAWIKTEKEKGDLKDPILPPPQYLRIVAAELLGRPERANWKTMDPTLDKELTEETIALLKPYFAKPQLAPNPKKGHG